MYDLALDLARVAHLFAFAVGFGAAVLLEFVLVHKIHRGLAASDLKLIHSAHDLITGAVGLLWVTGLALIALRTSGDFSLMSPKLWTKLTVVSVLTGNMVLIAMYLVPVLDKAPNGLVSALPTTTRLSMGAIAGVSAGCWFSALVLGAASGVKPLGFETLVMMFVPMITVPAIIGTIVAYNMGPQRAHAVEKIS